jgi:DNA-binding beta-propeller fold protein YncE
MKIFLRALLPLAMLLAMPALAADAPSGLLYRERSFVTLPSTDTYWDYIKFEPGTSRLFMARVEDGLTVYDVDKQQAVTTVENSIGANGPLLLPQFNRGYVAMTDGSLLSFELNSLKVLGRQPLADGIGLNSGILDPATSRIHFITGTGEKDSTWFTLDAATGKLLGKTVFPFRKMDDPATDGKGNLFAPARLDDVVLKLDSKTLKEQARWSIGCNVSKVRYQASIKRIIGACVGDAPVVFALDPETGAITARVPIGKGLDGLAIDEKRKRIISSNGADGTLSVVAQDGPDAYRLLGQINTRVGSRMMDIDQRTGNLYVVNADSTQVPDAATGKLNRTYHPNSFKVHMFVPE